METVVCRESYSSQSVPLSYRRKPDGTFEVSKEGRNLAFSSLAQTFRTVFLPQGYPESVSEDYLAYQIWDTIQAFCSSITGTLATQAMLKGVGVGDVTATAAAATITWLLKDGTGMCGRIVFAWYQGSSLDCDAKRWRLFADILNDAAICIELISPYFPYYFTAIACVSGLLKSIVGVAGGATRAALTLHQARRNNMADVSAKDGSQETLVNLAALVVGLLITPMVSGNSLLTWFLFFLFTFFHLYANYRAVTCVVMNTLNQARLHILMKEYLTTGFRHYKVLSPAEANAREPVLRRLHRPLEVNLGVQFGQLCKRWSDMKQCAYSNNNNGNYWLGLDRRTGSINILLHRDCTGQDIIKACFHAEIIINSENQDTHTRYFTIKGKRVFCNDSSEHYTGDYLSADPTSEDDNWKVVRLAGLMADDLLIPFFSQLKSAGWVMGHTLLGPNEWRAEWSMTGIQEMKAFKSF